MKILFLDFDGVLNTSGTTEEFHELFTAIELEKVALLNKVIEATGAKIVISSDWRLSFSFQTLVDYLKERGFSGEVIGVTPDFYGTRVQEIHEWLTEHPSIEKYAIVDDRFQFPKMPFVKTSSSAGLTEKDVEKLIALLN